MTVIGVAAVAAVVSYEHASDLVWEHGESGWTGRLIPLTVDGLIYASSMVVLDSARRGVQVPSLARWLLGLGIVATLGANIAHGLGHGIIGAAVAAWPAVALVGSYEPLMMVICGAPTVAQELAELFAADAALPGLDPADLRGVALEYSSRVPERVPEVFPVPAQRPAYQAAPDRRCRNHDWLPFSLVLLRCCRLGLPPSRHHITY